MPDLRIHVGDVALAASWTGENPETRRAIEDALPLEGIEGGARVRVEST